MFELEESDADERNKEPALSALNTKTESEDMRTNPYSSEVSPVTTTMEDTFDAADCTVTLILLEEAEMPEAKRRFA